jgi:hypothetical protein
MGMIHPNSTSISTIQKINFTKPFHDKYNNRNINQIYNYDFSYILHDKPLLVSEKIVFINLIFVYGPNIAFDSKTITGTGTRTKVKDYNYYKDYFIFKNSVKQAFYSGIINMINNNINVAILAPISGGIYSGFKSKTNIQINNDYESIINEVINIIYKGRSIGSYFNHIILPKL